MAGLLDEKITPEDRQKEGMMHSGHAHSLGDLCMVWASLDVTVDSLFQAMLNISRAQVAAILSGVDNISARCEMLKRLIYAEEVNPEWVIWFVALLNRVSNELAPLRNRYIHDQWSIKIDQITRIDKRAKIGKSQSRQPLKLEFDTRHVADPHEVYKLSYRIRAVFVALIIAELDLRSWRKSGRHLELSLQYLPASKANARYHTPLEQLQLLGNTQPQGDYVFD